LTVGVPEIHLDTWGLKYVKKKNGKSGYDKLDTPESPFAGGVALGERGGAGTQATNRISDADAATPDAFRSRQEDSKGDKDVGVVGHAGREGGHTPQTAPQVHSPSTKDPKTGKNIPSGKFGVGSASPAGSTQGSQQTPKLTTGQHSKNPKGQKNPTSAGTAIKNPEFQSGKDSPTDANLLSTETRSEMRGTDPKTGEKHHKRIDRYGVNVGGKKEGKRQPKSGKPDNTQRSPEHKNPVPTGGGAPKIKAILDLAIIKCKLLKMKTKKHDFIEENKPTRPAYRKDNNEEEESKESRCVSCGQSKKKGHKDWLLYNW